VKWIRWIALLAGIGMFAASFMLPAVKQASSAPGSQGIPGYECAFIALVVVLEQGGQLVRDNPVQFFAVLFSGWINPVFLVSLLLILIKPRWRFAIWLRYVVTAMFVCCWIVFYQIHLDPRQGYFLWMFGILLALYSNLLSAPVVHGRRGDQVTAD
jgi:TctA family transporter